MARFCRLIGPPPTGRAARVRSSAASAAATRSSNQSVGGASAPSQCATSGRSATSLASAATRAGGCDWPAKASAGSAETTPTRRRASGSNGKFIRAQNSASFTAGASVRNQARNASSVRRRSRAGLPFARGPHRVGPGADPGQAGRRRARGVPPDQHRAPQGARGHQHVEDRAVARAVGGLRRVRPRARRPEGRGLDEHDVRVGAGHDDLGVVGEQDVDDRARVVGRPAQQGGRLRGEHAGDDRHGPGADLDRGVQQGQQRRVGVVDLVDVEGRRAAQALEPVLVDRRSGHGAPGPAPPERLDLARQQARAALRVAGGADQRAAEHQGGRTLQGDEALLGRLQLALLGGQHAAQLGGHGGVGDVGGVARRTGCGSAARLRGRRGGPGWRGRRRRRRRARPAGAARRAGLRRSGRPGRRGPAPRRSGPRRGRAGRPRPP